MVSSVSSGGGGVSGTRAFARGETGSAQFARFDSVDRIYLVDGAVLVRK